MMTTANPDGSFDSRPMATQETEFDGTVWFLTHGESGKVHEIADDAHITLLYSDAGDANYVVAKGRASISKDKAKIKDLWNPMFKAWFPNGQDDPSITVLKVDVHEAQFWTATSSKIVRGVQYLAAAVTGDSSKLGEHGKVTL